MSVKTWFGFAVEDEARQYAAQYPGGRPVNEERSPAGQPVWLVELPDDRPPIPYPVASTPLPA